MRIKNGYGGAEKCFATIHNILYESEQYYLFNTISQNTRKILFALEEFMINMKNIPIYVTSNKFIVALNKE